MKSRLMGRASSLPASLALVLAMSPISVGDALGATINSDPASNDNVRIYAMLEAPAVTLVIDESAPSSIPGESVMFAELAPGPHRWTVTLPDGSHRSAEFTLSQEGLVESKGRRWWCLAAGRRAQQLTLLQLASEACKSLADAGPD